MLSIELTEEIEARFEHFAKRTGRCQSFHVREAILEKNEDMEEVHLAEETSERIAERDEQTLSAEEIWRGLEG